MTAEKKLESLLKYIQSEVDHNKWLLADARKRRDLAEKQHDYERARMYAEDVSMHSSLVVFGLGMLEYVSDLEMADALTQMRIASAEKI